VLLVAWGLLCLGLAVRAFAGGCLAGGVLDRPRVVPVRIDPNRAGVDDLQSLPGIAAGRAEAIVLDRVRRGPFRSSGDLDRVDGIGASTVQGLLPFLLLPHGTEAAEPR
jgi:competence ComEA-like helix-hairpin-helix protein